MTTEENKDVNEESQASPETSTGEQEQAEAVREDVNTQEADASQDVPDHRDNYKEAIKREEERLKKVLKDTREQRRQAELQTYQQPVVPANQEPQSDIERKWEEVQVKAAEVDVLKKMVQDQSFKDRQHLVMQEMQITGKDIEAADDAVLARMMRENITSGGAEEHNLPKQLQSSATPERPNLDGDKVYSNIIKGKADNAEARVLSSIFNRRPHG